MHKKFNELSSTELSALLKEYHKHKVNTDYGWNINFSIKWFYENQYKVESSCQK